jgi:hypothetical protein
MTKKVEDIISQVVEEKLRDEVFLKAVRDLIEGFLK